MMVAQIIVSLDEGAGGSAEPGALFASAALIANKRGDRICESGRLIADEQFAAI